MSNKSIGILVGSLRKDSFSKKIAETLVQLVHEGFDFKIIAIGQLPFYNQDFDDYNQVPDAIQQFRNEIDALDGFIFVTPEYNRSAPAVLKNALDVASRPYGQNKWNNKPAAIVSVSTGNISGFGANHHLRQSFVFLNVPVMQQPEAYLANIKQSFDENGKLTERTTNFLQKFIDAYLVWFQRIC